MPAILQGFTPAYAGNTLRLSGFMNSPQVHPRIRGEYLPAGVLRAQEEGSPPHTRGIQSTPPAPLPPTRFTPAYAGNTGQGYSCSAACRVHPRIRGEYNYSGRPPHSAHGSPPHTRGIPMRGRSRTSLDRFTPAYAGNTSAPARQSG